ncbi:MAG: YfcE family phosphodiesterase [Candidatus Freyarchaeota archaeon]|nr:YfcE family phosphodiesterase [Candidatus Freyrarchaeum guaymaensis]
METLILVIGDFHVPDRVPEVPQQVKRFVESNSFNIILSTGDLTSEKVLEWLKRQAPLKVVMGNMDYLPLPKEEKIEVHRLKIGLTHGTGVWPRGDERQLVKIAERMDVDILISGHTHRPAISLRNGRLLINPGSATGAWGGSSDWTTPSFMTMKISGEKLEVETFILAEKLKRQLKSFKKEEVIEEWR